MNHIFRPLFNYQYCQDLPIVLNISRSDTLYNKAVLLDKIQRETLSTKLTIDGVNIKLITFLMRTSATPWNQTRIANKQFWFDKAIQQNRFSFNTRFTYKDVCGKKQNYYLE